MNEQEAIKLLKSMQNPLQDYADMVGAPVFAYGHEFVYSEPEDYAIETAISALEEVQQYRAIGTVEECRAAREKQTAKKVEHNKIGWSEHYNCSVCGFHFVSKIDGDWCAGQITDYCPNCGQRTDWSEEE